MNVSKTSLTRQISENLLQITHQGIEIPFLRTPEPRQVPY